MYMENTRHSDDMDMVPAKSRSEKIIEARRAFADSGSNYYNNSYNAYHPSFKETGSRDEYLITNEKKHPFGIIRLMAAGMLFLILGIAFYNGFSYNGFDKDYVIECLDRSGYWDNIIKNAGEVADKVTEWYNSLNGEN